MSEELSTNGKRFEGWTSAQIDRMLEDIKEIRSTLENHVSAENARLEKIERWQAWVLGAAAATGCIAGLAMEYFLRTTS